MFHAGQPVQVELRHEDNLEHLGHVLSADRTLVQLLSTPVASHKVTAVEDHRVDVSVHAHLAL